MLGRATPRSLPLMERCSYPTYLVGSADLACRCNGRHRLPAGANGGSASTRVPARAVAIIFEFVSLVVDVPRSFRLRFLTHPRRQVARAGTAVFRLARSGQPESLLGSLVGLLFWHR